MASNVSSKVKIIVKVAAAVSLLLALIFGSAGTFNWPEAWIFLILYMAAVGGGVILFILRTSLEDKTLHEELSGYKEYAKRVRYKLIPGIW